MKLVKTAFASALALTLVACGGGGGGGDSTGAATAPVAAAVLDKSEFLGTWKSSDAFCGPSEYNPSYWASNSDLIIGETTVDSSQFLYTDATCTTKAGKITLHLSANFSQGSVVGKTNVARLILTGTGFSTTADGGSGVTLTKLPVTGVPEKTLLDVDSAKLHLSDPKSALDADGYPTAISTTAFLVR